MATTFGVDIRFAAQTKPLDAAIGKLNDVERVAKRVQGSVDGKQFDALGAAVGALPGRFGAAANGILEFNSNLRATQQQAKATAAQVAALQAALTSKKIQLSAKGGIGGEALKREISDIEGALSGLQSGGIAAGAGLGVMATAAVGAAVAIGGLVAASVRFNNQIETSKQQLTLFTQSAEKTEGMVKRLQVTADQTSLGLPGLLQAATTLSAYGVSVDTAVGATQLLGDVALGNDEKLQRFAVNLGQIASLGKAYTVDLKQFAQAGVPIFEELGKVTGKTTNEVMRMAEEGQISYATVIKALLSMTEKGSKFYNGAVEGGTDMSRSLQQLTGAWERLQAVIGNVATPAVVAGINKITDTLNGVVGILDSIGNKVNALHNGPLGQTFDFVLARLKDIVNFVDQNPALAFLIPGVGQGLALNSAIRSQAPKGSATGDKQKAADRAKLEAESRKLAEKNAQAELEKLAIDSSNKRAALALSTERSLIEARIGFEEQVADFRRQQLQEIAGLERQISDERRLAEFKVAQAAKESESNRRLGALDNQIIAVGAAGGDTTALEAQRAIAAAQAEDARKRAQIEFDATTRRIEIQRRLTDFQVRAQQQMGELQLSYTRQTDSILRQAGNALKDLMAEGAKAAKAILESVQFKPPGELGLTGGRSQSGGAFSQWDPALLRATAQLDEKYKVPVGTTASLVMFESSGNTAARGPDVGGGDRGHGLFQVMRPTARELGVDHNSILRMGGVQQIGLLDKYLAGRGFKPGMSAEQMYATVLGGNPFARGRDLNGTTPGSGAAVQRGYRSSAAAAINAAGGGSVAANNIRPTSPAVTAAAGVDLSGLQRSSDELKALEAANKRQQLLDLETQRTEKLRQVWEDAGATQADALRSSVERNDIEQRTLQLMQGGMKPELAAQLATNQQINDAAGKRLESARAQIEAAVNEKGITEQTKKERQAILDLVNAQIAAQPELLKQLNGEAQQTQALADQRAAMDQAKSDAQGISSTITGGFKEALKAAVTGGDVKAAMSNMLSSLGDRLLDIALRPLEDMLTNALSGLFNPQTLATNANTAATYQNTAALTAMGSSLAGMAGVGAGGDIFGGIAGIAGAVFGVAGAGFGGGAFGSGFNPLSTGKMFPGGIFASGGSTPVNQPVLVGERGPELFVPGQSGGITNHQNLRSMMASSGSDQNGGNGAPVMNMSFETVQIMDQQWVDRPQLEAAMAAASKRGAAEGERRALDRLKQSPSTRRGLGL